MEYVFKFPFRFKISFPNYVKIPDHNSKEKNFINERY